MRLPLSLVVAIASAAVGAGSAVAVASARQAETVEKVSAHELKIEALERESQANRERVLRIEILAEQMNKTVERIEKKIR